MHPALPFIALWLAGLALCCQPAAAAGQQSVGTRHVHTPAGRAVRRGGRTWAMTWLLAGGLAWSGGLLDARGALAVLGCIGLAGWWRGVAPHDGGLGGSSGKAQHSTGPQWLHAMAPWLIGALALALALHIIPGFHNPLVLDGARWRPGDPPFSLSASFDKACAGLLLLATVVPRCIPLAAVSANASANASVSANVGANAATIARAALLTTFAALGLGWAWGLTEPAMAWPQVPGHPEAMALFLALNLFVTCVAEEAFFRGLLQSALMRRWAARGMAGTVAAIALPAALFGLAHLGGGPLMAVLATIVGIGSGWAFARTGRIAAAVLTHFTVNAVHLLAFTYPARVA